MKKQRHHFANKGPSRQSYGFSVVIFGCEIWTIPKAECQRTDVFKQWCWRRLLRVPCTERTSTLNIHWKDWYWSWSSNTLATWRKGLTHWKRLWCWESLRAEGGGGKRGWDGWMASPTQWAWVWVNSGRYLRTGKTGVLQSVRSQSRTWLSYWTTTTNFPLPLLLSNSLKRKGNFPPPILDPVLPYLLHIWKNKKSRGTHSLPPSYFHLKNGNEHGKNKNLMLSPPKSAPSVIFAVSMNSNTILIIDQATKFGVVLDSFFLSTD